MKSTGRNKSLLERVREIKQKHPFWGYRRVWAYLRYREGLILTRRESTD